MKLLVRVRVSTATMADLGKALQGGGLDQSALRGDWSCLKDDPAVGYCVWEVKDKAEFDSKFNPMRKYFTESEAWEVISPQESFKALSGR